jgi:hypothetical protein
MRAWIVLLGLAVLMLGTRTAAAEEGSGSVWDRSVALEARGDLAEAERLMLREYGEHPDNYWAGLRLAYLALLQERYQEARSRYLALREHGQTRRSPKALPGGAGCFPRQPERKPGRSHEVVG